MLHLSTDGLNYLRDLGKGKNIAAQNLSGQWAIGPGITGDDIGPNMQLADVEIDKLLQSRIKNEIERCVHAGIGRSRTSQHEFDAMVILAFDIGCEAFIRSHLLYFHKTGDKISAAASITAWQYIKGREYPSLVERRQRESEIYRSGTYPERSED